MTHIISYHMNQDVNVYQAALLTSSVTDAAVKWKTPNKFFTPIIIIFTPLLFRFHTYCSHFTPILISHLYCFIFTPIVLISHLYCFVFTPIVLTSHLYCFIFTPIVLISHLLSYLLPIVLNLMIILCIIFEFHRSQHVETYQRS